jgi:microcystin-dependent protein
MDLPIGSIILWDGVSLPDGWQLCDGTNGTPNLISKFAKCANSDIDLLSSGGSEEHNHSNGYTGYAGNHGHTGLTVTTGSASETKVYGYSSGTLRNSADGHNHGTVSMTPDAVSTHRHSIGNTNNANHMPPYKILKFIMRMV